MEFVIPGDVQASFRQRYQLVSIESLEDPQTGRLLQIDGIFHRF